MGDFFFPDCHGLDPCLDIDDDDDDVISDVTAADGNRSDVRAGQPYGVLARTASLQLHHRQEGSPNRWHLVSAVCMSNK